MTDLQKLRDELAEQFQDSHKFFKMKRGDYIFKAGFAAALQALATKDGEK